MKRSVSAALYKGFYHGAISNELKKRGFPRETAHNISEEYRKISGRAKDIGSSKLLSSYVMGMCFIAMNRTTGKSPEENYEILRDGLLAS